VIEAVIDRAEITDGRTDEAPLARQITQRASSIATRPRDPFDDALVVQVHQILVAVDAHSRTLLGVGIYDPRHDSVLVAACGRHEFDEWNRKKMDNQNARRARRRQAAKGIPA